ncbi:MAG: putative sulfate exporter family transporter [Muribaculaceae bacterium]|nr:putative sulfate exporter family transporter [Muribaculaceae bacterium]
MNDLRRMLTSPSGLIYLAFIAIILVPWDKMGLPVITAPIALFAGLVFAFTIKNPCPKANKKISKYLLQVAVVCLGFNMNLEKSLQSGAEGMMFTVVSVVGVMCLGILGGYWLHLQRKTAYLISSGTAICGGSAIAAVGPVLKASSDEMAVSLGVIFILNAIALFIFPPLGHMLDMTQQQFGTWAAIAIHDTSSVVGAGEAFGTEALEIATLIKLTRALWIIPLALATMFIFRERESKISVPWFIFLFIAAMVFNTYVPMPEWFTSVMVWIARRGMVVTLFMIGVSLSLGMIKQVGVKPLLLAVGLWVVISLSSLFVVLQTVN